MISIYNSVYVKRLQLDLQGCFTTQSGELRKVLTKVLTKNKKRVLRNF